MKKKTVVIITVVIIGLAAIVAAILIVKKLNKMSGTPIIIKGSALSNENLAIDVETDGLFKTATNHKHSGRVARLEVIGENSSSNWCVVYDFPSFIKFSRPHITLDVVGSAKEVEVQDTYFGGVDVLFDDGHYNKSSYHYTSKTPLQIGSVKIDVNDIVFAKTKCSGKDPKDIVPCPTEFPLSPYLFDKLSIALSRADSQRCQP